MNAARGRRRHRDDLVAAISAAHRLALDGAVGFADRRASCGRPRRERSRRFRRRCRLRRRRLAVAADRLEVSARSCCVSLSPRRSGAPSGCRKIFALDGQRASRALAASESARSSSTTKPSRARRMAGADEIGEREFAGAVAPPGERRPATVPGTPTARPARAISPGRNCRWRRETHPASCRPARSRDNRSRRSAWSWRDAPA